MRLNDNNHDLLRTLVGVLEESQNPVAIAVAAHDLGEYVRYYPRGKKYKLIQFGTSAVLCILCQCNGHYPTLQLLLGAYAAFPILITLSTL